jgi:hypothetical protein
MHTMTYPDSKDSTHASVAPTPRPHPLDRAVVEAAVERLADLRTIATLLQWIENARSITDFVEFLADRDRVFAARFADNEIAARGATWGPTESSALEWLTVQQQTLAAEAEKLLRVGAAHPAVEGAM